LLLLWTEDQLVCSQKAISAVFFFSESSIQSDPVYNPV